MSSGGLAALIAANYPVGHQFRQGDLAQRWRTNALPCTIVYSTLPGTTEPQSFSMQFEVTTDVNSACPVPGSF